MIRRIDNSSPWPDNLMCTMFDDNIPDISFEELSMCLTPRIKEIIEYVFRDHMTQKSAAEKFGVTSERIRQIIICAIRKMRHQVLVIEYRRRQNKAIEDASKNFDPDDPQFIDLMELSVRSYNCLYRSRNHSMRQIGDLIRTDKLKNIRNLGKVSENEIVQKYNATCSLLIESYEKVELPKPEPKIKLAYIEFEQLGLQTRAINSLIRSGICSINDLVESFNSGQIYHVSDLGISSIRAIHAALKENYGMKTVLEDVAF